MKKATFFILLLPISAFSQVKDTLIPKKWQAEATYNLNGTQTSFVNWSAGGRNNISALASIIASATYSKKAIFGKTNQDFRLEYQRRESNSPTHENY